MIADAKSLYYRDKISNCTNQKELFQIVEQLLHQKGKSELPSHKSKEELTEKFNNFFVSKITKIREMLDNSCNVICQESESSVPHLSDFPPASEDEN